MSNHRRFDWGNVIERAAWTALQVPSVLVVMDMLSESIELVTWDLVQGALWGIGISAIKTIGQERLRYLREGRADV